jgi:hypothetical protein
MSILEKYREKHKFHKIKSLLIKCNNDINYLLFYEQFQEFEIEYIIRNFELNQDNWFYISKCQKLSDSFIEKYKNFVDWHWICKYQNISESFIEKHSDKVCWDYIYKYHILSEEFKEKHKEKLKLSEVWLS